jgi:hypothetical protein
VAQQEWVPIDPDILHDRSTLIPYKVRTGDSLDSIAKQLNCSWQSLALLNWGTDKPKEINWYLRHFVGCKKKSGENYLFSDSADPGIIWLPRPMTKLTTRVRRGTFFVSRYPIA